ncbi:DUF4365 domain-containing protein [Nesterenkonia sphaerica]|uniref:DUF4365 domain-containing protein n=1 Tax=Nesterenkonia sphaerica TaxID=1804988 RepID=A0A5R8ZXU8_9MICC|nr:DUF4365 domain-containing protein [Nesterenkonia sphaerica]TLP70685.1 DUF4365 domain-containing protein [Nesterenkonia sphaerica]
MEAFQGGTISAIAASAGCKVNGWNIDDGIDFTLVHNIAGERMPLDVQLKATTVGWNASKTALSVRMSRRRYDEMRNLGKGIPGILVTMDLPEDQAQWAQVTPPETILRHSLYWTPMRGAKSIPGSSETVTVSVPSSMVFDDHILCQIMARLRAGGFP